LGTSLLLVCKKNNTNNYLCCHEPQWWFIIWAAISLIEHMPKSPKRLIYTLKFPQAFLDNNQVHLNIDKNISYHETW